MKLQEQYTVDIAGDRGEVQPRRQENFNFIKPKPETALDTMTTSQTTGRYNIKVKRLFCRLTHR